MMCHSCNANSGIKRISPAHPIYEGKYWLLEHAYPTSLVGWLVIVLRRHCENLHELSRKEWQELAEIQFITITSMKDLLNLEREYVCCFAEMEGFKHIHFHLIPKYEGADLESIGTKSFHHLKVSENNAVKPDIVIKLCADLRNRIQEKNMENEI